MLKPWGTEMPARTQLADYREQWPKEFAAWQNMRYRCSPGNSHVSSKYYEGRGIQICAQWSNFLQFLQDVGPRPEGKYHLDRIDNSKGYEPGNVRWAPLLTSYLNRSTNGRPPKGCRFSNGKWRARIKIKQKEIALGVFDTFEEAHFAYVQAKEYYAKTNFARCIVSS
jgi:hypothetical protein